jgi:hypothetical protein
MMPFERSLDGLLISIAIAFVVAVVGAFILGAWIF